MKLFALAALCAALGGCSSVPSVLGHCELPAALAQKEDPVADIPTDKPIPREQADQIWAQDRGKAAKSVFHTNALIDYVAGNCQ